MTQFSYTGISGDGHQLTGSLSANSREEAIAELRKQGARPLMLKESKATKKGHLSIGNKVKSKDIVIFTRELSTMVSAGVALPRALSTLGAQSENKYFKDVVGGITKTVEGGAPLADALAKYPNVFSEVYVNMVRAGEAGGILDDILKRLALQVEKDATIRKKIHSAMAYPIVILTITILAFFGIMLFILPKIGKILKDLGGPNAQLPIYTRIMLSISHFLTGTSITGSIPLVKSIPIIGHLPNVMFFVAAFILASIWFKRYTRTPQGAYRFHALMLRLPIIGPIVMKIAVARFARTFSSLMGAGVSVLESLEVTGKAVGNKVIQKEINDIAIEVKNGKPLGKQLTEAQFFPPIVGQMMTVGEETGKIDQILVKIADFYEEEVDTIIDSLASIIEPIMIIVLGALVGLIAASVMGPIANLSKNISG